MSNTTEKTLLTTPPSVWRASQIIALEWLDGPRGGLCRFDVPSCTFYFEVVADQWLSGTFGDKLYRLQLVDNDALTKVVNAYGLEEAPHQPIWAPHGSIDDVVEERVNSTLEKILATSTSLSMLIRSKDLLTISEVWLGSPKHLR